jgi:hypothetical protein
VEFRGVSWAEGVTFVAILIGRKDGYDLTKNLHPSSNQVLRVMPVCPLSAGHTGVRPCFGRVDGSAIGSSEGRPAAKPPPIQDNQILISA